MKSKVNLSDEQKHFVDLALEGHNVLVDACIGSGKTTSIQELCNKFPKTTKILYMTYNRLLKLDAQDKIVGRNVTVTNYHGFVYPYLRKHKVYCGIGESIRQFNQLNPEIKKYDVLIIDEYQDINLECSELLEIIKKQNPGIQIIAVGDMAQKIYDFTTHDVEPWIKKYLGNFKAISFTKCFRLGDSLASRLADAWNKPITGVNKTQKIKFMSAGEVAVYLSTKEPEDILALSPKKGTGVDVLNDLEHLAPDKFNKYTTYASIKDTDFNADPDSETAIFTTYDSSKGMERPICVIFDYVPDYFNIRMNMPDVNPEIIRNIFLVAASRGKDEIIFVKPKRKRVANNYDDPENVGFIPIEEFQDLQVAETTYQPFNISGMFNFKYVEDIEACYDLLEIEEQPLLKSESREILDIQTSDGLLDISPTIIEYAKGSFFKDFDIYERLAQMFNNGELEISQYQYFQKAVNFQKDKAHKGEYETIIEHPKAFGINVRKGKKYETNFKHDKDDLQWQLLVLLAAETKVYAYIRQINRRYITKAEKQTLIERLNSLLSPSDTHDVLSFINGNLTFYGFTDVVKDDTAYSITYIDEIKYTDYLTCAMKMILTGANKGVVWSLKTNQRMTVTIPDRQKFMDQVVSTITKRSLNHYTGEIPGVNMDKPEYN